MSLLSNFKAPYDHTFIEFDYAQLEIRVLALASMDTNLINDINAYAPVKFISEIKKDDNKILLIFEETNNDLKKI